MKQRILGIVLAAATASIAWAGAAPAQSVPAAEPVAKDRGPKTLLEGILGSSDNDRVKERSDEEEHLDADRPHFPEATTTVGNGRAILESGYTFTKKGDSFLSHSGPEACSASACLRTGSSFGSDRIFFINGRPWRERRRLRAARKIFIWE